MGVVTGSVEDVFALESLGTHCYVFEDFVEGCSHVDVAGCVGRSVHEIEFFSL